MSLPRPTCPANEDASAEMPSIRSPSEAMQYVRWSWTSAPYFWRRKTSAIAMPTAFEMPWPSGPVVTSMPSVSGSGVASGPAPASGRWNSRSGWPGVLLPH
ncbi:unannotated protein [freshwater metagenome]|uniref:Unannotated protein n=1 Tax=freshwater metagenome TaxID=449393 RepID=A0A6J7KU49_9ZZZZ